VFFVECRNRLPRSYLLVHQRLCERGFIKFIVAPVRVTLARAEPIHESDAPATIYKKVDNYILAEVMPVLECDFDSPFNVCQA
jgi:hypothetical protein